MTKKKIALTLIVAAFILVVWLFVAWLLLPGFLETRILPELALKNGIGWRQGRIHRIGLTGFDAGSVVIGRQDRAGLVVDAVHVDYTPWGVYHKRIDNIRISGLSLNVTVDGHGVAVRGLETTRVPATRGTVTAEPPAPSPRKQNVNLRNLSISHAVLNLDWNGRQWRLPFELTARLEPGGRLDTMLTLYPCGDKISIAARWLLDDARGDLSLSAERLSLEKMAAMAQALSHPVVADLRARGEVAVKAGAAVRLHPFGVENLVFSLVSSRLNLNVRGFGIAAPPSGERADGAFNLHLQQRGADRFQLKAGNLTVTSRVPVVLEKLAGELTLQPGYQGVALQAATRVPAGGRASGLPVSADKDLVFTTEIVGGLTSGSDWHLEINNLPAAGDHTPTSFSGVLGGVRVASGPPTYRVRLQGREKGVKATYGISATRVVISAGSATVRAGRAVLEGAATADMSGEARLMTGSADLVLSGIDTVVKADNAASLLRAVIPEVRGRAEVVPGQGPAPAFRGYVALAESSLAVPGAALIVSGITARVPWQWPVKPDSPKGLVSVGRVQWRHLDMGAIGMTVGQHSAGLAVKGHHHNTQLPDLSLDFSGDLQVLPGKEPRARLAASWSRPATAAEIDLGRFAKGGAGIFVKGALNGEFEADYSTAGVRASACARMDRADLRIPEKDLAIENLSVGVCLPHLPQVTTSPSQTLTFARATKGKFKIEGGLFHFQMEPHKTLFVEKGRVGWSGGQIRLQPMRITPRHRRI